MNAPTAQELRHLITIINVEAPYTEGGEGTELSTHARVRARIYDMGGSLQGGENIQEQQSVQSFEITIRYIPDVTAFQQIKWGTRRLVITAPPSNWTAANKWLVIQAQETTEYTV
jgi:head-tail adaptor